MQNKQAKHIFPDQVQFKQTKRDLNYLLQFPMQFNPQLYTMILCELKP